MLILIVQWPLLFKSHWISKRIWTELPKIYTAWCSHTYWAVLRPQTEYFHAMNDHIRPTGRAIAGILVTSLISQEPGQHSRESVLNNRPAYKRSLFHPDIHRLTTCTLSSKQRKTKSKATVLLKKLSLKHSIDFFKYVTIVTGKFSIQLRSIKTIFGFLAHREVIWHLYWNSACSISEEKIQSQKKKEAWVRDAENRFMRKQNIVSESDRLQCVQYYIFFTSSSQD